MNPSLMAVQILLFLKQAAKLDFIKWIPCSILVSLMYFANQKNKKRRNPQLLAMYAKLSNQRSMHNVSFVLCGVAPTV